MLQKLSEEKINDILEAGILEFADQGPDRAHVSAIARAAGVSVGVLYKYYENKEALFLACLRHALLALDSALTEALHGELTLMERAETLIRIVLKSAREHPGYHVLYHEITAGSCRRFAPALAREIEGVSAKAYTALMADAQGAGALRRDMDPRFFAFFFDNLLMMLQFSRSCAYYQERFAIYCGERVRDEEAIVRELMWFLTSACCPADGAKIQRQSLNGGIG